MKLKKLSLLVTLVSSLILLTACLPEATTVPEGEQESPIQSGAEEDAYPAPGEEQLVQPDDSQVPYPAPQESLMNESAGADPYPSIEVVGSDSSVDLSEAITADEFTVMPDDVNLQATTVFVEHSEITLTEGDPAQVELVLVGNLPSPCHQLRVFTSEPDNTRHIYVQAYSVTDPEKTCAQVLEPFIAVVPLGEYSAGTFTLSINDQMKREYTLP